MFQGFTAFCYGGVELRDVNVTIVTRCSGKVCGGLYAVGTCPCVTVTQYAKQAIAVAFRFASLDGGVDSAAAGMKIETFSSAELTDEFVALVTLEVSPQNILFVEHGLS